MDYSHFLFTQLFYAHFPQADIEYDTVYPYVIELYNEYNASTYNTELKCEYECMENFLCSKEITVVEDDLKIENI